MSKHIFTPGGKAPLIIKEENGALKFFFPVPETFTFSNSDLRHIDDFFEPYIKPDGVPGFWSGLRPETPQLPALYLKKRVYPTGLGFRTIFSFSNPFRRAEWAARAVDAGISTPAVLAIGFRKQGLDNRVYCLDCRRCFRLDLREGLIHDLLTGEPVGAADLT